MLLSRRVPSREVLEQLWAKENDISNLETLKYIAKELKINFDDLNHQLSQFRVEKKNLAEENSSLEIQIVKNEELLIKINDFLNNINAFFANEIKCIDEVKKK